MIDLLKSIDELTLAAFDVETTGLSSLTDRVIEVAAVKRLPDGTVERRGFLLDPGIALPSRITEITGLTDEMIKTGAAPQRESLAEILAFCDGALLCAHNAPFDIGFLAVEFQRAGLKLPASPVLDTLKMARHKFPSLINHKLGTVYGHLFPDDDFSGAHRAVVDAEACLNICRRMADLSAVGRIMKWGGSSDSFDAYHVSNLGFGLFSDQVAEAIRSAQKVTVHLHAYPVGVEGVLLACARERNGNPVLLVDSVAWGNRPLPVAKIAHIDFA